MTLDGFKTGMTVREDVLKNDTKTYQKRPPKWKETDEERERFYASGQNEQNLQRPNFLGRFIMDELNKQAEEEGNHWLAKIETTFEALAPYHRCKLDEDLVAPWNKAIEMSHRWVTEEKNTRMKEELEAIAQHVKKVYSEHRYSVTSPSKGLRNSPKKAVPFTGQPIEIRQDTFRKLSRQFASFPSSGQFFMQDEEIARLRASYAYKYDHEVRLSWTRFPWDVAMRELGAIKARATGRHKTIAGEFYDHFNMKHSQDYHM
jgi:RNA-dependent RNA polymerase